MFTQGSKKVLSGRPGQVDSPFGQVPFHSHLPFKKGIMQDVLQLKSVKDQTKTCPE